MTSSVIEGIERHDGIKERVEYGVSVKPRIIVTVDREQMKAHLAIMRSPADTTPLSKQDIFSELRRKGVVFGIKSDAIEKLVGDNEFFADIIVAEGVRPSPGREAEIRTNIYARACSKTEFRAIKERRGLKKLLSGTRVVRGDLLMTKIPATSGCPGTDVFGENCEARTGDDRMFQCGENVYVTPCGLELRAAVDGIALSVDGVVHVVELRKEKLDLITSDDGMRATIRITPGDLEKMVSGVEDIQKLLDDAGVKSGARNDLESLTNLRLSETKDIIVAEGIYPHGSDAELKTEIPLRKCGKGEYKTLKERGGKRILNAGAKVKKNDLLMVKTPAEPVKNGLDIYGNTVPSVPGKDMDFPAGENVYASANGAELRSKADGIALLVDGIVNVIEIKKEKVEVKLSKDEMSAVLTITPGDGEKVETGLEEIKAMLKSAGVKYGVRTCLERLIPKKTAAPVDIEVASGLTPINGKNGSMRIVRKEDKNGGIIYKTDETGNVDFRERLDTGIVKKGDVVAILVPPTGGRDGITVTGRQIPAMPGKPGKLIPGRNVIMSDDGQSAIAQTDGKLLTRGAIVMIDNVLIVDGNVDYSTGNIKFEGSVYVKGDVLPEFYISASGDVEVMGVVDGGNIVSDSNVIVRGAIYGGSKSRVKAKGAIWLRSADNALIHAGGCLYVEHFLRNCVAKAGEDVKVLHQSKGHILGGRVTAGECVETHDLGAYTYIPTVIELGASPETYEEYSKKEADISQIKIQMEKLEPSLRALSNIRSSGKELGKDKMKALMGMYHAYMALQGKMAKTEERMDRLSEKLKLSGRGRLTVSGTMYPGARVTIGINSLRAQEETARVVVSGARGDSSELEIRHI